MKVIYQVQIKNTDTKSGLMTTDDLNIYFKNEEDLKEYLKEKGDEYTYIPRYICENIQEAKLLDEYRTLKGRLERNKDSISEYESNLINKRIEEIKVKLFKIKLPKKKK